MALLAYPNVSEGRDAARVERIARAFGSGLLDVHRDPDHGRSAFTLTGAPGGLARAVLAGAAEALRSGSLEGHLGVHPHVGVLDVAPIIWTREADRGAAVAEALVLADGIGAELGIPVLLYGELAGGRTRAELRRGGVQALVRRVARGELRPDYGPARIDPARGATLVAARPPLLAFNLELAPGVPLERAREVARAVREGGEAGLPGVRAIGVWLDGRGIAQVSTNIEDPDRVGAAAVLAAVARRVPVAGLELVGLAPAGALEGLPAEIPLTGARTIEEALRAGSAGGVAAACGGGARTP